MTAYIVKRENHANKLHNLSLLAQKSQSNEKYMYYFQNELQLNKLIMLISLVADVEFMEFSSQHVKVLHYMKLHWRSTFKTMKKKTRRTIDFCLW